MKKDEVYYAVLRLNSTISLINPITGKREEEKLNGVAGYIPCYATYEEAEEASCDGKYSIMKIKQV